MNKDQSDSILIFLHIPKAAGTTMHRIIERQYDESLIFSMDGARVMQASEDVRRMSEDQKNRIEVIKGHMAFGLHSYMPKTCHYFTLLRDPIERLKSHYYYVIRTPNNYLYETVTTQNMSLEDYLLSDISLELDNGQTRVIGSRNGYPIEMEVTSNHLREAKNNLSNSFKLVGLSEHFDETLLLAKKTFGWKNIYYSRSNVSVNRPAREALSDKVMGVILEKNKYDCELYSYAKNLFEESKQCYEGNYEEDLAKFIRTNKAYGFSERIKNKGKKYVKSIVDKR